MAIYSLSIKTFSRNSGPHGQNAIALAAYRSGSKLIEKRSNEIKDFSKKTGIIYTSIYYPEGINFSRQELWNMAEAAEKRKDGRIAREILIALPHEITQEERKILAENFAKKLVKRYNIAVDLSLHEPTEKGDDRNFHAHLLLTTREITKEGLTEKSILERSNTYLERIGEKSTIEQFKEWRNEWEKDCNEYLNRNKIKEINAKNYKEQNINRIPTIHMGKTATNLERKGIKTIKGNINRAIKNHNRILHLKEERQKQYNKVQKINQIIENLQKDKEKEINIQTEKQPDKINTITELLEKSKNQYQQEREISIEDLLKQAKEKEIKIKGHENDGIEY